MLTGRHNKTKIIKEVFQSQDNHAGCPRLRLPSLPTGGQTQDSFWRAALKPLPKASVQRLPPVLHKKILLDFHHALHLSIISISRGSGLHGKLMLQFSVQSSFTISLTKGLEKTPAETKPCTAFSSHVGMTGDSLTYQPRTTSCFLRAFVEFSQSSCCVSNG